MGKRLKLSELEEMVDRYFDECAAKGIYPDEAGLIVALGISRETYDAYLAGADGKYAGHAQCLEAARLRRESIIVREIFSAERSATGKMFLAKQTNNGGLNDKPREQEQKLTIEVVMDGKPGDYFD